MSVYKFASVVLGFAEEIALLGTVGAGESPRPGIAFRVVKAFIAAGYGRRGFEEFISVASDSSVGVVVAAAATAIIDTSPSLGAVDRGGRHIDRTTLARKRTSHAGENEECKSTEVEKTARMHAEK